MHRRIIFLILLVVTAISCYTIFSHPSYNSTPIEVTTSASADKKVLLIPLDGRPPCRKFVIDAGKLTNTAVITPPSAIQDYYTQPGDTKALQQWITENIAGSQAVILSIDQLLYGGLLAAREADKTAADIDALLAFLQKLHANHPEVPIYAFNILPRIAPPASIDGYEDNKNLIRYSRLVDRYACLGSDEDLISLRQTEEKINPESLKKYRAIFSQNTELNKKLSLLAEQGTLKRLIIGQDDGEKFSIPNIEKRELRTFLSQQGIATDRVFITHGADEVALTLLTEIDAQAARHAPMVYIEYNDPSTAQRIMPYMAVSVEETVLEKIHMLHGETTASPDAADFILYISCGTEDTLAVRQKSAAHIKELLTSGKKVALVDLSKHFTAEETLLPSLIQQDVPLNAMIAYAGWNTTSNSIGTALSEAELFCLGYKSAPDTASILQLYQNNLIFLNNRYLEDFYYLKDVISLVDTSLKKAGYKNVYDLDLEHNYLWATQLVREAMQQRITTYKNTRAFRLPFQIHTPDGPISLRVRELTADISYPWPRTFEIYLQTTVYLDQMIP